MKKTTFTFPSADKKTRIHGAEWGPDGEPRGVVQIGHGMTEYIDRYDDLAEFFAKMGLVTAGCDVIGHGKSVMPGEMPVHMERWMDAVSDFETCRKMISGKYPGLPYFILGFSLGSFVAQTHQEKYPGTADGLMLLGSGFIPTFQLKIAGMMVKKEGEKAGMNQTSPGIHELSFGTYNRHFKPNRSEFDWLYRDEEYLRAYEADERIGRDMSCRFFEQFLSGMEYVNENLKKLPKDIPVLFVSGEEDPVGDFGKGVTKLCEKYRKMGIRTELKIIPRYRHDILHDGCRDQVCGIMAEFLKKNMDLRQNGEML